MSDSQAKVQVNGEEFEQVLKRYKKLKKYMKSNLFEIHRVNGSESVISNLTKDYLDIDDEKFGLQQTDAYQGQNNSNFSGSGESSFIPSEDEPSTGS